ncbi:MAG: hypothetical protein U5R49_11850 [Deltaproteobacteria bacterium]|nr:hypothetical protein [Deltaproteobacteria bacterium]
MLDVPAFGRPGGGKPAWTGAGAKEITEDILITLIATERLFSLSLSRSPLIALPLGILPRLVCIKACLETVFAKFIVELPLLLVSETLIGA